ncbi:putative Bacterial regulatory protein, LacI [Vibrio nigripulchritudo SFn27]|nr:putative Bacterial regulatory protein, LacI [Vibrio nigripulchritudo BLFn1]CCN90688.1 putative Bacterial regulatory protein, LacI [Vibrio nigripulchritudo SFn27]CCN97275.1 putative Bacterial regulatory protein, LacI [Vibrio nigripulchritudo ENn2]CCO39911.1 putative Bacterial regulatory protein, LacI [Vibrio nigripulchritudo SFn135]CCO51051.1 putative Bacterial regulatory protein, LacI [Vibrio nigripulchritudo Wn13]
MDVDEKEPKMKRVTMTDIARAAGVSQGTVSLVLNDSRSIKLAEETRKRVLEVAQELGYSKKVVQDHNRKRKIAVIVNDLVSLDPFVDAVDAITETAAEHQRIAVLFNTANNEHLEDDIFKEIASNDYDGVIIASSMTRPLDRNHRFPEDKPVILLNCFLESSNKFSSVIPDDHTGMYNLTTHLIERGYSNIAFIGGEEWMLATQKRRSGFLKAHEEKQMTVNEHWQISGDWSMNKAYQETLRLLSQKNYPDAFACASDLMALGVINALLQQGIRIPEDVAVCGYDNQPISTDCHPTLTSYSLPYEDMGKMAVELLLQKVDGNTQYSAKYEAHGELKIRESTSPKS